MLNRRYNREWLLVALITLSVTLLFSQFSVLSRFSDGLYDVALGYTNKRPADPDIVIIAIDDKSLSEIGFWPWSRQVHAHLLGKLRQARAVGFDIVFADSNPNQPNDDKTFARALQANKNVVLASFITHFGVQGSNNPVPGLTRAASQLGYINIMPDFDGMARYIKPITGTDPEQLHLSLAMLAVGGEQPIIDRLRQRTGQMPFLIPYAGPPGHFAMVSYSDVLFNRIPSSYFDHKYVLIGAWSTGLGDRFPTPMSSKVADNMSGVEILANVLQSAREERWIQTLAAPYRALLSIIPVLLLLVAVRRLSPRLAVAATMSSLLLVLAGSILLLKLGSLWISPLAAMAGIALTYPLWSWRTQEMALSQMSREMTALNLEYPVLRTESHAADLPHKHNNSLNERLIELRFALNRVRSLRQFISDSFNAMPDPAVVFDAGHQLTLWTKTTSRYMTLIGSPPLFEGLRLNAFLNNIIADPILQREIMSAIENPERGASDAPLHASSIHKDEGLEVRDRAGNDLLLKYVPTYTSSGQRSGYILNLIDISALRQAERNRDETLRFISHDMRSPQNSILALIQMQRGTDTALPTNELLQRVERLSGKTIELVEDFVQFSRAEKSNITFVPINLSDLLDESINEFWATSRARNIDIRNDIEPPVAFIKGNQSLLMRCFNNLLDNALKYSENDTTITCSLSADNDSWKVVISDQGRGISKQDLQRLFTPFTRVGSNRQPDPGGLGLGLMFVKTVIARHHGTIEVHSTPGQGSDFIIRLPRDESEESGALSR